MPIVYNLCVSYVPEPRELPHYDNAASCIQMVTDLAPVRGCV